MNSSTRDRFCQGTIAFNLFLRSDVSSSKHFTERSTAAENYVGCTTYRTVRDLCQSALIASSVISLAELRVTHLDRSYFVTMGTYQMAVLLQFNERQELTLGELEEATKLNIKELEKQALSLVDAKLLLADTVH